MQYTSVKPIWKGKNIIKKDYWFSPIACCSKSSSSDENDDNDGVEDTANNEADTDQDLYDDHWPCYIVDIRIKILIFC